MRFASCAVPTGTTYHSDCSSCRSWGASPSTSGTSCFTVPLAVIGCMITLRQKNFLEGLLSLEPHNRQAISLKKKVEVHITKDGLIGLAIIGGVAAVAGLVGALVLKR
eukprot:Opistho-2@33675